MKFRTETDSMGTYKIPLDKYYGIHTQRSFETFAISGIEWHPQLLIALAQIKKACAHANYSLKFLPKNKSQAISRACDEIIKGDFADQFPLDIFQTGSGTATHMNINEVIAHRAAQILGKKKAHRDTVHPNDNVNKGQSTNNVIPSAIRIASFVMIHELLAALTKLEKAFSKKAKQFKSILKSGRTHLQDAVPITLGQEFQAYASAIRKHRMHLSDSAKYLGKLGVGGNAVGTGLNTSPQFRKQIINALNTQYKKEKIKFTITTDGIESTQFLTDVAHLSGSLKSFATDLHKIANDLRLLSSGPKTGLNEINLPAIEPGSSIMPGKINPAIPEVINQVACQVVGNDAAITMACASGNLNLNTHMPIIAHNIVESLEILTNASDLFADKCINGITANKQQCAWYVEHSMALATALNPVLGYDKVAMLVKESKKTGKSVKELVLAKKLMNEKELNHALDPRKLTKPNL